MNADIKQPIYHIFRDSLEVSPLCNLPSLLPLPTDCFVSAQFNANTHFQFCCLVLDPLHPTSHQNHHHHPSMPGISLTDIQWGSFSPLVALSLHELLVCPPSLHKINTRFVHNCPLRPQTEATPFICRPHTFACLYDHTWLCLYLCLNVHWVFVYVSVFGIVMSDGGFFLCGLFLSKLGVKCWSTCSAQVNPSHPFEPPLCVLRSSILPYFLSTLCMKK